MNSEIAKTVVAVLVFIQEQDRILLVKHGYGQLYWSLPGGVMESGESIEQAASREVREETGLDISLGRLVGVYSLPSENALALTFEARVVGGELCPCYEIIDAQFFPLSNLPGHVRKHFHERVEDFIAGLPNAIVRMQ